VTTFAQCPRAWHFRWVRGFKEPPSLAQQRGNHVHKGAEHTLNNRGDILDNEWGRYVESMVPHLPIGQKDILVEKKIWIDTAPGLPRWLGYIDLIDNSRTISEYLRITDHKTTSNFRYAKTPKELLEDTQLMSYARWCFVTGFEEEFIEVGHLYIKTAKKTPKKPKVKPVYITVDQGHVASIWERDLVLVEEMVRAAEIENTDLLEAKGTETGYCKKYRGCPHRSRCGLQGSVSLFGNGKGNGKGTEIMTSFLQRMKDKKAKANGATKPPTGVLASDAASRTTEPDTEPEESEPTAAEQKKAAAAAKKKAAADKKAAAAKKKAAAAKKKAAAPAVEGFTLYINCAPVKDNSAEFSPTLFEDWLSPIVMELNETVSEKGLSDYRHLPYAEEKALFAVAVNESLKEMPPQMIVNSGTPGAKDALAVLIPHASLVVRSFHG
jgi:hypothetical protein